jgi:hypothetical protein
MYDGKKIIPGLLIFLAILSYPLWHNAASGKTGYVPKPKAPRDHKECIEPKAYIRVNHKALLEDWRISFVRDGVSKYEASNHKTYNISLSRTCMNCHKDKEEFCDQCHNYAGVTSKCWDCHIYPKQLAPSPPAPEVKG